MAHLAALAQGEAIERPLCDFSTYTRVPDRTETIRREGFLIVEGLFTLIYPDLLPLYQLKIYLEAPDEVCFERRLRRDAMERGRTQESVRRQYDATVRPSSITWVRPSAVNADLVLDGTGALDWKVERVLAELRRGGFSPAFPH